jgi:hypothetical protein
MRLEIEEGTMARIKQIPIKVKNHYAASQSTKKLLERQTPEVCPLINGNRCEMKCLRSSIHTIIIKKKSAFGAAVPYFLP